MHCIKSLYTKFLSDKLERRYTACSIVTQAGSAMASIVKGMLLFTAMLFTLNGAVESIGCSPACASSKQLSTVAY